MIHGTNYMHFSCKNNKFNTKNLTRHSNIQQHSIYRTLHTTYIHSHKKLQRSASEKKEINQRRFNKFSEHFYVNSYWFALYLCFWTLSCGEVLPHIGIHHSRTRKRYLPNFLCLQVFCQPDKSMNKVVWICCSVWGGR